MPNKPRLAEALEYPGKIGSHGTGSIPDPPDPRDYDYKAVAAAGKFQELPDSISLADLLPAKTWDQGNSNACTSFAANLLVAVAREKAGIPYTEPSFAATWYWTKLALFGPAVAKQNVGASIREAVLSTRREGIAPSSLFPFANYLNREPGPEVATEAEKHQSLYFFRVDDYEKGIDVDFLYRCLAEGWPVSISLPLYDSFEPEYGTGLVPYPNTNDRLEGWHTMVLYGYYLNGRRPYFRCRNSWGTWGGRHINPSGKQIEPGTCRIPMEYVRDYGYDCWTIRAVEDGVVDGVALDQARY